MEVNKKKPPLMTRKDMEGTQVKPSATRMDLLVAVTSVARKVYYNFQNNSSTAQQQPPLSPKNIYHSLPPKESFSGSDNSKNKYENDEDEDDDEEDEHAKCRRPIKRKKRGVIYSKPIDQHYLPADLKTLIVDTKKGTDLKLVIQKKLTESDARKGQNRFLMPLSQIQNKFLLDHEEESLKEDKSTMAVNIIEPNHILKETSINLKRWEMKKSNGASATSVYVLNKTWYSILLNNGLGPGATVQLWAFRVDGRLNFALVNVS